MKRFFGAVCTTVVVYSSSLFAPTGVEAAPLGPSEITSLTKEILHNVAGDDLSAFFGKVPTISIVSDPAPFAFIDKENTIVLSKGIVEAMHSRTECAFIITHEIGHLVLGHNRFSSTLHLVGDNKEFRGFVKREFQADAFAVETLRRLHYDPVQGAEVLARIRAEGLGAGIPFDALYPSVQPRLLAIGSL